MISASLLAGERRAIARSISRIEHGSVDAAAMAAALAPHLGRAHVIGITGAPGAGKSTLIHAMLGELLARGKRIGVVAVDPSSPISGGAVLGDRVRMGRHGAHPDVFIRSLASRGHLGGLSSTTAEVVDVLDAAGFDSIIVETVGAGQSEVEIMRVADTRVVACPPGLGDNIQAIKAGILEIADLLVVTKADLAGAEATARDLRDMLHLRAACGADAWKVPVLSCCADSGQGIAELMEQIEKHGASRGHGQRLQARATPQVDNKVLEFVRRMVAVDPFLSSVGVTCRDASPGSVTLCLTLGPQHINFNGTCHGGVIFTMADSAFGLAANAHGKIAVGIDAHITYQKAARVGERLLARSVEVSRSRKVAVYRVDVSREGGDLLSSFTGTVYITGVDVAVP